MGIHSEAKLDRKFVEFAKLLNIYLQHFPRHEKYGLCQNIRQAAYGMYELIVEAQKRYHKKTTLTNLDIRHEQLRMLIRLAHELGYFGFKGGAADERPEQLGMKRYLAISRQIDELGRMVGGWIAADCSDKRESS
ncbi:MAG TPA: diversity-generating retroelement protein Avd [Hyphomicrobiales bacterium]|nr:diversity-generating retroelement protein Avd [Hyphomicrobiales bacterium]